MKQNLLLSPFLSVVRTTVFSFLSIFQRISGFFICLYVGLSCIFFDINFYFSKTYVLIQIDGWFEFFFFFIVFLIFFHFSTGLKKLGFHSIVNLNQVNFSLAEQFELNRKSFHFIFFYSCFFFVIFLIFNRYWGFFILNSAVSLENNDENFLETIFLNRNIIDLLILVTIIN